MKQTIEDLKASLFATEDGGVACGAINALSKHAKMGSAEGKNVLAEYVNNGLIGHMREYACFQLGSSVTSADEEFAELFRRGLSGDLLRYWSILGYINVLGRGAYEALALIAVDQSIPLGERCHAVKCLAKFSKQKFDRKLPSDPGSWKETDLRLSEIDAWARMDFPEGPGYSIPNRHPALDNPTSALEKIVNRLERKLAKKRDERQDLAAPSQWLMIANPNDIQRITERWKLPSLYLDFLMRFSPIMVTIESRRFYNHFQLFGAAELIDAQDGYSFNSLEQRILDDWPAHFVVVASHGGDPFVLDLSKSDGEDAPVLTAEHGTGEWDFSEEANSFAKFLESLAK
jgi:hypothetical protein